MMNERLIAMTVQKVNEYYEAEGICEMTSTIDSQARDWYNHSEIVDAEMLAAAVMNYGYYKVGTMWNELEQLREFYFPTLSVDERATACIGENEDEDDFEAYVEYMMMTNYHIGEIEEAQHDAMWW